MPANNITTTIRKRKDKLLISLIAVFIVLDVSVLFTNYIITQRLNRDALEINVAGRQRMLSQQLTKQVLYIDYLGLGSADAPEAINSAVQTSQLFGQTLRAFMGENGGVIVDASGKSASIRSITPPFKNVLQRAELVWQEVESRLNKFVKSYEGKRSMEEQSKALDELASYLNANNLGLLQSMNALTNFLQSQTSRQVNALRAIQIVALAAAIVNFVLILANFSRELRVRDQVIDSFSAELEDRRLDADGANHWPDDAARTSEQRAHVSFALRDVLSRREYVDALRIWDRDFAGQHQVSLIAYVEKITESYFWSPEQKLGLHQKLVESFKLAKKTVHLPAFKARAAKPIVLSA